MPACQYAYQQAAIACSDRCSASCRLPTGVSFSRDGTFEATAAAASGSWAGSVEVHRAAGIAKSRFLATLEAGEHVGEDAGVHPRNGFLDFCSH